MENHIFYGGLDIRSNEPVDKRMYINELTQSELQRVFGSDGSYGSYKDVTFNKASNQFIFLSEYTSKIDVINPVNWKPVDDTTEFPLYDNIKSYSAGTGISYAINDVQMFYICLATCFPDETPETNPEKWYNISSSPKYYECSITELLSLIEQSMLQPGMLYKINGVDPMLYDDGTFSGTTIYLTALSMTTLSKHGHGEFWFPKYDKNIEGFGIWDDVNTFLTSTEPVTESSILSLSGTGPTDIILDYLGNVYVTNSTSNNVTKIMTNGVSYTYGTTGTTPFGIAIDSFDNIYTANSISNNVTKITPSGVSSVFATTGTNPMSIVVDASNNIYTANNASNNITKITPAGVTTIFATTGSSPVAMIIDVNGNLYTANSGSSNVSKITPAGVSTILGATGDSPQDITIDSLDNIYTINRSVRTVTKITPEGISTTFANGFHNDPVGITIDSFDNLYVSNTWTSNIVKITPTGTKSSYGLAGSAVTKLVFGRNGILYAINSANNNISKILQNYGHFPVTLASTGTSPFDIVQDSAGNIYTSNTGDNTVTKITPAGVSTVFATTVSSPAGITIDSFDNIYVCIYGNDNILKITPAGVSTVFATAGDGPQQITIDSDNNLYVCNVNSKNVSKITPAGVSTILGATGIEPYDIAIDSNGNVYTANLSSGTVTKITPAGVSTILFATVGPSARGITVDFYGNIYTANSNNNTISKITPSGEVFRFFASTGVTPTSIVVDAQGNLYTTNIGDSTITKVTYDGISTILCATGSQPTRLTIDNLGYLYVTNQGTNTVSKIPTKSVPFIHMENIVADNGATGTLLASIEASKFISTGGNWNTATKILGMSSGSYAYISNILLKTYGLNNLTIWGGYSWKNLSGLTGTSITSLLLDDNWEKMIWSSENYNKTLDIIHYDIANDVIVHREDMYGNIVQSSKETNNLFDDDYGYVGSPINVFQWGNPAIYYANNSGVNNNSIIQSYCDNINFRGYTFSDNVFNSAHLTNNRMLSGSRFYSNVLSDSYIESNIMIDSNISRNELRNGSDIQQNSMFIGYITLNQLEDSSIDSNLMSNSSISGSTLRSSNIGGNFINSNSQITNTIANQSQITNNSFDNSIFNSNVMRGSSIYQNTLVNNSYINESTMLNSVIDLNRLNIGVFSLNELTSSAISNMSFDSSECMTNILQHSQLSASIFTMNSSFSANRLIRSSISNGLTNPLSEKTITRLESFDAIVSNTDINTYVIFFSTFNRTLYTRPDGTLRVRFYNDSDLLSIVDPFTTNIL